MWRNWMLDLFRRKRREWVNKIKVLGAEVKPAEVVAEVDDKGNGGKGKGKNNNKKGGKNGKADASGKSAIELARERFGAKKAGKSSGFKGNGGGQGTGANQVQKIGA